MPLKNKTGSNQLRIIAGEWGGRKLHFPDAPNLRPTPDRVRETIFNWLMPVIQGARCLDLFAGSGALGLEALSRGAQFATFVDSHKKVIHSITQHLELLNAGNKAEAILLDGMKYLNGPSKPFDIVFLDPPYQSGFMQKVVPLLEQKGWLAKHAMIYLEIEKKKSLADLPHNWICLKDKTSGDVNYYLYQRE